MSKPASFQLNPIPRVHQMRGAEDSDDYLIVHKNVRILEKRGREEKDRKVEQLTKEVSTLKSKLERPGNAKTAAGKRKGRATVAPEPAEESKEATKDGKATQFLVADTCVDVVGFDDLTVTPADASKLRGMVSTLSLLPRVRQVKAARPEIGGLLDVADIPRLHGVMIHGQAGTGKRTIARALAAELRTASGLAELPLFTVSGNDMISGITGDSERNIKALFAQILAEAPCVVLMTEVESVVPANVGERSMLTRMVTQFTRWWRHLAERMAAPPPHAPDGPDGKRAPVDQVDRFVIIAGLTEKREDVNEAAVGPGYFDVEVPCPLPSPAVRTRVLTTLAARHLKGISVIDPDGGALTRVAHRAAAFAHQDLAHLIHAVVRRTLAATLEALEAGGAPPVPTVTEADLIAAMDTIKPQALRTGFTQLPDATWADLGGVQPLRERVDLMLLAFRRADPAKTKRLGLRESHGMLLYGPPGCGKTMVAKAIANQCRASFISIKGPELLDKYVGESERAVRNIFSRARLTAPSVIFFDEIDALSQNRDDKSSSTNVVNQLLTELDGMESAGQVMVIGATNRPDIMDQGLLRAGRLGNAKIFVDLPDDSAKLQILVKIFTQIVVFTDDGMLLDEAARAGYFRAVCDRGALHHFNCADLAIWKARVVAATDMMDAVLLPAEDALVEISLDLESRAWWLEKARAMQGYLAAAGLTGGVGVTVSQLDEELAGMKPSLTEDGIEYYRGMHAKMNPEDA